MRIIELLFSKLGYIKATEIDAILRMEGGAGKRHDEQRELIKAIADEAPDLIKKKPWVVGWITSQDAYLNELRLLGIKHQKIANHWETNIRDMPSLTTSELK